MSIFDTGCGNATKSNRSVTARQEVETSAGLSLAGPLARLHSRFGTYKDILLALILDGGDDSGGNHSLLPSLGQVEVENTFSSAIVYVRFHLRVAVLSSDVNLYN